jgi:hypothetical protein
LHIVMTAAAPIAPEKRDVFLQRIAGHLWRVGYQRVSDADVSHAVATALKGLVHESAA